LAHDLLILGKMTHIASAKHNNKPYYIRMKHHR
jgi:hypothetical protein